MLMLYTTRTPVCHSWSSWIQSDPRTVHSMLTKYSSDAGAPINHNGSVDALPISPEAIARFVTSYTQCITHLSLLLISQRYCHRFQVGSEIEFDVFAKRSEEDDTSFLVSSPRLSDAAVSDSAVAASERHALLKHTVNPGTQSNPLSLHGCD